MAAGEAQGGPDTVWPGRKATRSGAMRPHFWSDDRVISGLSKMEVRGIVVRGAYTR